MYYWLVKLYPYNDIYLFHIDDLERIALFVIKEISQFKDPTESVHKILLDLRRILQNSYDLFNYAN